jgi:hypothetical protein
MSIMFIMVIMVIIIVAMVSVITNFALKIVGYVSKNKMFVLLGRCTK